MWTSISATPFKIDWDELQDIWDELHIRRDQRLLPSAATIDDCFDKAN